MTKRFLFTGVAAFLISGPAFAHPGHGTETDAFMTGLLHPISGVDHILAMVAVGLWAAMLGGKALWRVPAAFVAMMGVGFVLALAGVNLPLVEPGILASVIVLGLLVAASVRLPLAASAGLVGLFALFHGYAHGGELGGATATNFAIGFALATAALHGVGLVLGRAAGLGGNLILPRVLGGATALAGLALVAI